MTMTKKKPVKMEEWLMSQIKEILKIMNFGSLRIYLQPVKDRAKMKNRGNVVFSIKFTKCYRVAYIRFYDEAMKLWNDKQLDILNHAITHELMHIYTAQLLEIAEDRYCSARELSNCVEETTEMITLMFEKLTKTTGRKKPDLNNKPNK